MNNSAYLEFSLKNMRTLVIGCIVVIAALLSIMPVQVLSYTQAEINLFQSTLQNEQAKKRAIESNLSDPNLTSERDASLSSLLATTNANIADLERRIAEGADSDTSANGGSGGIGGGNQTGASVGADSKAPTPPAEEKPKAYDPTATTDVSETALFTGVTRSCWDEGSCTLCDILVVFINIADAILKLFAILASVFFVWGAGYMMMSSGNAPRIEKGKGIIRATIIGSIIVLFSWQLMNTVVFVLVKQDDIFKDTKTGKEVKYSPLAWYNVAEWCGTASGQSGAEPSSGPGAGVDGSGRGYLPGEGPTEPGRGYLPGEGPTEPGRGYLPGEGPTEPGRGYLPGEGPTEPGRGTLPGV